MDGLSLFTGVGGFEYAAEWLLGWVPKGYVEIEEHCQRTIATRQAEGVFRRAPIFCDIAAFLSEGYAACYRGLAQVVYGGPPCTPFSVAGKGLGWDDPRNLFPQVLETVRVVQPQFVFLENSPNIKGPRWAKGFGDHILTPLAELGFRTSWDVFRACDVGAPHRRARLFLLARLPEWRAGANAGGLVLRDQPRRRGGPGGQGASWARDDGEAGLAPHAHRDGRARLPQPDSQQDAGEPSPRGRDAHGSVTDVADADRQRLELGHPAEGRQEPAQSGGPWSLDAYPSRVPPRVADRVQRIRASGNGVVPLLAATAFLRLTAGLP